MTAQQDGNKLKRNTVSVGKLISPSFLIKRDAVTFANAILKIFAREEILPSSMTIKREGYGDWRVTVVTMSCSDVSLEMMSKFLNEL